MCKTNEINIPGARDASQAPVSISVSSCLSSTPSSCWPSSSLFLWQFGRVEMAVVVWSLSSSSSSSLGLQPVANANRTLKNLKMIETQTKSLSKWTVCAQVSSMTQYSISFTVWVQWCKWEIKWACHLGAASLL